MDFGGAGVALSAGSGAIGGATATGVIMTAWSIRLTTSTETILTVRAIGQGTDPVDQADLAGPVLVGLPASLNLREVDLAAVNGSIGRSIGEILRTQIEGAPTNLARELNSNQRVKVVIVFQRDHPAVKERNRARELQRRVQVAELERRVRRSGPPAPSRLRVHLVVAVPASATGVYRRVQVTVTAAAHSAAAATDTEAATPAVGAAIAWAAAVSAVVAEEALEEAAEAEEAAAVAAGKRTVDEEQQMKQGTKL